MPLIRNTLTVVAIATFCNTLTALPIDANTEIFGQSGRDGINGRSGRDGISAREQIIRATQQPQKVELVGTDGEAGESATSGESAAQCSQPQARENNICGAKGGNGGNGGNGGHGGHGGNATIYFQSLADLKSITLRNRGGRGGVGGQGGSAGEGCNCTRPQWRVSYCSWALMSQAIDVANAPWTEVERKRFRCSGDGYYDEQNHRPQPPLPTKTHRYGWKYLGTSHGSTFYCENGQTGQKGRAGTNGQDGTYGQVWLVKGDTIPQEHISYSDRPSALAGKTISLLKNNWLEKAGLSSLLDSGSDISDSYRLLQTVRGNFKLVWQTKKTFAELGDPKVKGAIAATGDVQLDVPGTLEYRVTGSPQERIVTVTGGIDPQRLAQLKFEGFDRFVDPRNFTLLDEANLISELKGVKITITVSNSSTNGDSRVSYAVTPQSLQTSGLAVRGRLYKVNLGDEFEPLVQPGQRVQYIIEIEQITRAGVGYKSKMKLNYVVGRVDFAPQVEYDTNLETN